MSKIITCLVVADVTAIMGSAFVLFKAGIFPASFCFAVCFVSSVIGLFIFKGEKR
jgi:hypothetical protein